MKMKATGHINACSAQGSAFHMEVVWKATGVPVDSNLLWGCRGSQTPKIKE